MKYISVSEKYYYKYQILFFRREKIPFDRKFFQIKRSYINGDFAPKKLLKNGTCALADFLEYSIPDKVILLSPQHFFGQIYIEYI